MPLVHKNINNPLLPSPPPQQKQQQQQQQQLASGKAKNTNQRDVARKLQKNFQAIIPQLIAA